MIFLYFLSLLLSSSILLLSQLVTATDIEIRFRLNLFPTIPEASEELCSKSNVGKVQLIENTDSLDESQAAEKLLYLVTFYSFGLSEEESILVEPYTCVDALDLVNNYVTLPPSSQNLKTLYFSSPLEVSLGSDDNTTILVESPIGSKYYESGRNTILKTGSGQIILQRMCALNDSSKADVSLFSTQNTFPFNNPALLLSLKKELETEYYLTFSVEDCSFFGDITSSTTFSSSGSRVVGFLLCWIASSISFLIFIQNSG